MPLPRPPLSDLPAAGGELACVQPASWDVRSRLWIYTNYDCNLRCSYCIAESAPGVERRGIGSETLLRVGAEAAALGFRQIYLTGGEPLLLRDIVRTIGTLLERFEVTVLTNATLLKGRRLEDLRLLQSGPTGSRLTLQISMDGATAAAHDAYRGAGSWERAMAGVRAALDIGCRVRLSTTVTPANGHEVLAIGALAQELDLGPDGHVVRDLVRRGFSREGRSLALHGLLPEVTVDRDGVYWHPIATDDDLLITRDLFPLADAVAEIEVIFHGLMASAAYLPEAFR